MRSWRSDRPTGADSRITIEDAARNNAALCDTVCRAHGLTTHQDDDAWSCNRRTPPLYPDAVTLRPHVDIEQLFQRIDATGGCSIKDSFADLPLDQRGLAVLFEAQWIVCEAPSPGSHEGWQTEQVADLVRIRHNSQAAILNRTGNVVGLSNVVGDDDVWRNCLVAIAAMFPGVPVVGYEHGEALDAALQHGFRALGPLRVWTTAAPPRRG